MARSAGLLLFSLMLLNLGGCASWFAADDMQDPQIRLVRVETVKAKLLQQAFILHFRIDNPNDTRLIVRSLVYVVRLNDVPLAEGDAQVWVSVPAHGRRTFEVPIRTNLWRHLKPIANMLKHPERPIRYYLGGELSTGLFFIRDLHLSRSGEIIPGDLLPE